MRRPVFAELAAVRRRQRWTFALRTSVWGLVVSSGAAILLGAVRELTSSQISATLLWEILLAGPVVGGLLGFAWPRSWQAAAIAVDSHYRLKDRSLTALAFVTRPRGTAWSDLQLADALSHLSRVEPQRVIPLRAPRVLPVALGSLLLAVALIVWPTSSPVVEAGPAEPLEAIVAEAMQIEEDLEALAEVARNEQNPELETLIEELREKAEEMKEPGVDSREALAKLSEMQTALQAQIAKYNVAAVDAQLQSLGNAMQVAEAFQEAGHALSEGKHEKAAEELEKIEEPEFERKEAKALEEKLKDVAEQMASIGQGALSDSVAQIGEGAKGNGESMKKGLKTLAKEARKQGRRSKIADLLRGECDKLGECKCNCQKNSLVKGKNPQKSKSPSSNFGMGTSGNSLGDATELHAATEFEQVSGQQGDDGDSEIETTHTLEGQQQAGRGYKEVYQKYRKLSESVLDSEPIPLGHRQTIRRYFELIRPQQADEAVIAPATTSKSEE